MVSVTNYIGEDIEIPISELKTLLDEATNVGIDLNQIEHNGRELYLKLTAEQVNALKNYLVKNGAHKISEQAKLVITSATCGKKPDHDPKG